MDKLYLHNKFPYKLHENTYHYVMWYRKNKSILGEEQITNDIKNYLNNLVTDKKYKFVWYENPKMTINDIYHVQVFWIKN